MLAKGSDTCRFKNKTSSRWPQVTVLLCVHTAGGESVKIRSGRPANDAVERFVDALTIERLVLYLKEPKRKQAC